jgi:hypothetical protein
MRFESIILKGDEEDDGVWSEGRDEDKMQYTKMK